MRQYAGKLKHRVPQAGPLSGKTIAIVHPAWRACGSYSVFIGQVAAWQSLGARVITIAVSDQPGFKPDRPWIWRSYVGGTGEMDAQPRYFAGVPFHKLLSPSFLRDTLWPYIHGDQSVIRTGMAELAALSSDLADETIDLVHCNHFFCMPVALKLAAGAPIALESHDVQARQFMLLNAGLPWLKPHVSYDTMLARELDWMRKADLLLHLNVEEYAEFEKLLPEKRHALLYPPVPTMPAGPGGDAVIIVSSRNRANVESILWFLQNVAPNTKVPFHIYGSVDAGIRAADSALHAQYKEHLIGPIKDLAAVYAHARLVLLPNVAGTGISIKTIEALSSGLPVIAQRSAFRGMAFDPATLANVTLAETPLEFAQAMDGMVQGPAPAQAERVQSATRGVYEATFSEAAYSASLLALCGPLINSAKQKQL